MRTARRASGSASGGIVATYKTYKKRTIERALESKGFSRKENDHSFFHYYTQESKRTPVWTKTSHGRTGADIDKGLFKQMANQCKLTADKFHDLVERPMSRADYEQHLHDLGKI